MHTLVISKQSKLNMIKVQKKNKSSNRLHSIPFLMCYYIALNPNQLSACLIHVYIRIFFVFAFSTIREKNLIHNTSIVFSNSNFVSITSFFRGPFLRKVIEIRLNILE